MQVTIQTRRTSGRDMRVYLSDFQFTVSCKVRAGNAPFFPEVFLGSKLHFIIILAVSMLVGNAINRYIPRLVRSMRVLSACKFKASR